MEGNHLLSFQISINRYLPGQKLGPGDSRWAKFNAAFRNETHTLESFIEEVSRGYAFCAELGGCQREHCGQWCCPNRTNDPIHCGRPMGYRTNRHWGSAQHIGLDFDAGDVRASLDYLLSVPLIAESAAFAYTTLSHSPASPRSRVVIITDIPFTDPDYYRQAKRAVMDQVPWGDSGVHDPSRSFYGTTPKLGTVNYVGRILPLNVIDELIEEHSADMEREQARRDLPRIPGYQVMGQTPAERYVNAALQQEVAWVASRNEGTGERHKELLLAALKLGSLRQSEWLPTEVRMGIDPIGALIPAANRNGYIGKYGEDIARRTIFDGVAYSKPRPIPSKWDNRIGITWSGGQWVRSVSV